MKMPALRFCFTWLVFIELNFTVAFLLIRKTGDVGMLVRRGGWGILRNGGIPVISEYPLRTISFSNLTWKLPWTKPTFCKVCRSCKQLNEALRSEKALHEVPKICEQLYEVPRICQRPYEVRRIRQELYEVCGTHKQLL